MAEIEMRVNTPRVNMSISAPAVNISGGASNLVYLKGDPGPQGPKGEDGNGIKSTTMNDDYSLTLTFDDGTSYTTPSIRGEKGEEGERGEQGYTPIKGIDYFDGKNGKDGKNAELAQNLGGSEDKAISQKVITSYLTDYEERITTLEQGVGVISSVTDSTIAYSKTVPVDVLSSAEVKKIGGYTRKCTNLLTYPYIRTTQTVNGITFTDNGDGSITADGTATATSVFYLHNNLALPRGNYVLSLANTWNNASVVLVYTDESGKGIYSTAYSSKEITLAEAKRVTIYLQLGEGVKVSNFVFAPMLNEGNVALPYEPYFGGFRSAEVTQIESVGSFGKYIYPIPEAIRNLEGYGWGINETVYNYVDFENKQFVKRVGKDDEMLYELETPEIIDISHLIFDSYHIEVESGGSVTMVNEYQYAVPSEITYLKRDISDINPDKELQTDETLEYKDGVLSVNTTDKVEADNSLPITSAAVYTTLGNIEVLMKTI